MKALRTLFFYAFIAPSVLHATQLVKTRQGAVSGVENAGSHTTSFKGIRHAASPMGTLRWHEPGQAPTWKGTLQADHFGASCMQSPNTEFLPYTKEFLYVTPPSEDCLFLNVWTPKVSSSARLPVLFFIPGGGFMSGSGDVPIYDGEKLAAMGMVVVTINYRVGVFGFLAHPDLTQESPQHASGNYGLLDQMAALHWVQDNIRGFGGDPQRVTIAGQSAGATSVLDLLASPLGKGLYRAAIADSGIGGATLLPPTLQNAELQGTKFADAIGAHSLAELRDLPASLILQRQSFGFGPNRDGYVLSSNPETLTMKAGEDADVPVITGFLDGDTLLTSFSNSRSPDYEARVQSTYGPLVGEYLRLYPAKTAGEKKEAEAASSRDRLRVGSYLWAVAREKSHRSPVWTYYFTQPIPWPQHPEFDVFHTGELPYAFGTLGALDRPWTAKDRGISKTMMSYWKDFVTTGDPNGPGVPGWKPVLVGQAVVHQIGNSYADLPLADEEKMAFWERYFAARVGQGN